MRSHNLHHVAAAPFAPLLIKEVREIVAGRALWIMLLIMCPLVGYSFFQALSLYGESSVAAQQSPALAVSLSPLDGVLVPTFGSLYVAVTLLFPFVAIRTLSHEKESGSLKLLVQLPYSSGNLVLTKMIAVMVAWLLASFPVVTALIIWGLLGGHLAPGETFALFLGHALYAALVGAIALFCASITDSAASAAIVTLAFTIGSWALDFTIAGRPGILEWFARLSLTQTIKSFEQGLLALGIVFGMAVAIGGFLVLAGIWMHPGVFAQQRLRRSLVCLGAVVIGLTVASQIKPAIDTSEDQRNSFPIADQRALKTLREQLSVIVHLAPEDPRYMDFRRNILAKLDRAMPFVTVRLAEDGRPPNIGEDAYGTVEYRYGTRNDASRSTSYREVLPLIYNLAGIQPPAPIPGADYPGYPLVANPDLVLPWFFGGLPILIGCAWWWSRRPPSAEFLSAYKGG